MKLITETTQSEIQVLTEEKNGQKNYFIKGVFMESDTKNRNGRVYPGEIMEKEIGRYNNEYVKQNRAMGELGHPEGPTVNLERVSHIIKNLSVDGKQIIGEAKIMDTPYGKIVKNLIDEGAKLGVSSRGMGSLKEQDGVNVVQEDFMLAAVDVVADPSAPNAFVNGIMEGKEWIWDNGVLKPVVIEQYKKVIKNTPSRKLEEQAMNLFKDFISKL
ncbi:MAG: primosomal protein [Caulobacteraceae bacterium]|nr:primosomal protein [Caulobacteraceae bacterium]